jgi:hypothetical protein
MPMVINIGIVNMTAASVEGDEQIITRTVAASNTTPGQVVHTFH